MKKEGIVKYATGGACALMLGSAALIGAIDDANYDLAGTDRTDNAAVQTQTTTSTHSTQDVIRITPEMDIDISFSAAPIKEENGMAVFAADGDYSYIYAQLEDFEIGEQMTISGTIAYIDGTKIVLSECEAITATATTMSMQTTSIPAESMDEPIVNETFESETATVIVYVSTTGKYHSKHDCSGMKTYTEMAYDDAVENGYVACKRCY